MDGRRPPSLGPFLPSVLLLCGLLSPPLPSQELGRWVGESIGDGLGAAVASLGDVTLDGVPDLVLGAPQTGRDAGYAWVVSGRSAAIVYRVTGRALGDELGRAVAAAGDVDGDGVADVLIGAPGDDASGANAGRVLVLSGRNGGLLRDWSGAQRADRFGHAAAAAGDVDGDGVADLAVGAPWATRNHSEQGLAQLLSGRDGAPLQTFLGEVRTAHLGFSLASVGDVDGDGVADLATGAPGHDGRSGRDEGRVVVFSGRSGKELLVLPGFLADSHWGFAVAGPGDLDLDGTVDLIVGAPSVALARGLSGRDGSVLVEIVGSAPSRLGESVAGAGDVNGDGNPDLLVGAPKESVDTSTYGGAVLVSGRTRAPLHVYRYDRRIGDFGRAVATALDLNADGLPDVLVGGPLDDRAGFDHGTVTALAGDDLFLAASTREVRAGVAVDLVTREGLPGDPVVLFLMAVDGRPVLVPFAMGAFGRDGSSVETRIVQPGLQGHDFTLQAFALVPWATGGRFAGSCQEVVQVR